MSGPMTLRGRSGVLARVLGLLASASILSACEGGPSTESLAEASCFNPRVRDPDFATSTAWTTSGGATITPGSARFTTATLCDHGGIEQTLATPALTCSQALVMRMDLSLDHSDQLNFAVGVNGGWSSPLLLAGSYTTEICLGAGALGGAAHLLLGGGNNAVLCPPPEDDDEGPSLAIEHIAIDVDTTNACPPPGTVPNGDFEGDGQSWLLTPGGGTAEIVRGPGEARSFAAHLATDRLCEEPAITGEISLPTSAMLPNPALRVWSRGSSNAIASVRMGPLLPAFLTGSTYIAGTSLAGTANICIPRWAQGTVQPFELSFVATEFTETCADEKVRDFAFDDLDFVSDPACETDANVFDPGFERIATAPGTAPFWSIDRYDDEPDDDVALKVDAAFAHTGNVAALLTASTPCPHSSLSGGVTVPASVGTAGPALKFWYEAEANIHTGLGVSMSALLAPVSLPATSAWTQVTACLDPHLGGRPDLLRFGVVSTDGGGICADTFPAETFAIDDVELTTDASCSPS
jgi:hypothetical protein